MTKSGASLKDLADAHGVHSDYYDLNGTRHQTSPETMRALLFALGVDCTSDALIADAFQGHRAEQSNRILPTEIIAQTGIERDIIVRQPCDWVWPCRRLVGALSCRVRLRFPAPSPSAPSRRVLSNRVRPLRQPGSWRSLCQGRARMRIPLLFCL